MAMNSFSRSDTYPTSTIVSSFAGNYPYKSTNVNGQNPSKYFDNINTDRIVASILMRLTLALFSLIKFRSLTLLLQAATINYSTLVMAETAWRITSTLYPAIILPLCTPITQLIATPVIIIIIVLPTGKTNVRVFDNIRNLCN